MKEKQPSKSKAFSRRDFIKGMGGSALGTAIVPKIAFPDVDSIGSQAGKVPVFSQKEITLIVNGKAYSLKVEPRETLLEVLRERLNLTGAKKICDRGECGGCTVMMEGEPVYSCLYLAIKADGKQITTIEGLAVDKDKLHPVQQAFIDKDGYQCGFCTPGFIMSSVAFLQENTNPDLKEIKKALSGNLCRCGNYQKIYEAVAEASKNIRRS